jgi:hypothetical protein
MVKSASALAAGGVVIDFKPLIGYKKASTCREEAMDAGNQWRL